MENFIVAQTLYYSRTGEEDGRCKMQGGEGICPCVGGMRGLQPPSWWKLTRG